MYIQWKMSLSREVVCALNYIIWYLYRTSIHVSCTSNVSDVGADVFKRRKVKNNKYTRILFVYNKLYTPDGKIMVVDGGRGAH